MKPPNALQRYLGHRFIGLAAQSVLRHPGRFAWHTLKAFRANQGLLLAGAVAYYALLSIVPLLILTPLTFLGGTFYSISVLPPIWQKIALFNPVVYLVSGFRWSFFEISDVSPSISVGMTLVFLGASLAVVWWIFKTGYKLKK